MLTMSETRTHKHTHNTYAHIYIRSHFRALTHVNTHKQTHIYTHMRTHSINVCTHRYSLTKKVHTHTHTRAHNSFANKCTDTPLEKYTYISLFRLGRTGWSGEDQAAKREKPCGSERGLFDKWSLMSRFNTRAPSDENMRLERIWWIIHNHLKQEAGTKGSSMTLTTTAESKGGGAVRARACVCIISAFLSDSFTTA